jgi:hypothetical protein
MRRYGDDVLALDYVLAGFARTWTLPAWTGQWRAPMNKQLSHIAYARVREPKGWDHRMHIRILLEEFRKAWSTFQEAVIDRDFRAEYDRQFARWSIQ